jgi:hypothetical protein
MTTNRPTPKNPKRKPDGTPFCRICFAPETKDETGYTNLSYALGICLDCLMEARTK